MENIGALQESLTVGSNQQTLKARLQSIPKKHCLNSFHPFPTPQSHQQSNNHDVDSRANGEKENYCWRTELLVERNYWHTVSTSRHRINAVVACTALRHQGRNAPHDTGIH